MRTDWNPLLRDQFDEPYWRQLQQYVAEERQRYEIYPPADQVYTALHLTAPHRVRAVIVGQDPYHGRGQAHGLCFSVPRGVRIPPSLANIQRELHGDLGIAPPGHGNLEAWAAQGVLLLNATLTVRSGQAGSHHGKGWERFTSRVLEVIDRSVDHAVFIVWGASARRTASMIDRRRHTILESVHPSPLSAHSGFFGSRPFSRTNDALVSRGQEPIDWRYDLAPEPMAE